MRTRPAALATGVIAVSLLITGCSAAEHAASPEVAQGETGRSEDLGVAEEFGLAGLDAREVIEKLDTTTLADRPEGLQASIRPDELVLVGASGQDEVLPMPDDEMYIAFAPYVNQTHECTFHAPNSCVGEMQDAAIEVTVTDKASGEVYVDERTVTYDNGFIGYWLPRDVDATIAVAADGKTGSVDITTRGADAPTCITTLRIA